MTRTSRSDVEIYLLTVALRLRVRAYGSAFFLFPGNWNRVHHQVNNRTSSMLVSLFWGACFLSLLLIIPKDCGLGGQDRNMSVWTLPVLLLVVAGQANRKKSHILLYCIL